MHFSRLLYMMQNKHVFITIMRQIWLQSSCCFSTFSALLRSVLHADTETFLIPFSPAMHPIPLCFTTHFSPAQWHVVAFTNRCHKMWNVMRAAFPLIRILIWPACWLNTGHCIGASWARGGGEHRRGAAACDWMKNSRRFKDKSLSLNL